jgi:hypothetical protein
LGSSLCRHPPHRLISRPPYLGLERSAHQRGPHQFKAHMFAFFHRGLTREAGARFAETAAGHHEPAIPVTRWRQLRRPRLGAPAAIGKRLGKFGGKRAKPRHGRLPLQPTSPVRFLRPARIRERRKGAEHGLSSDAPPARNSSIRHRSSCRQT